MSNIDVVIMAAGKGTRMQSSMPKVLHRLGGRALLQHVIDTAKHIQARRMVVITGHGAEQGEFGGKRTEQDFVELNQLGVEMASLADNAALRKELRGLGVAVRRGHPRRRIGRDRVAQHVPRGALGRERGRTVQFWGDILLEDLALAQDAPADAVPVVWGYDAGHPFKEQCGRLRELGRAYLACCPDEEREILVESLRKSTNPEDKPANLEATVAGVRAFVAKHGYAIRDPQVEPKSSSTIAMPIFHDDRVLATIGLTYYRSAVSASTLDEVLVPSLREAREGIEASFRLLTSRRPASAIEDDMTDRAPAEREVVTPD